MATTVRSSVLPGSDQATLGRVIAKSIAVSSGKGGVGKTITACNLAIYYARKGMRVGLVDLDPLSDVSSLLDVQESEQALQIKGTPVRGADLSSNVMPVFRGLEILFPFQKLSVKEARSMRERIYTSYLSEIDSRYDLLIFDMPAGMDHEENLVYLPYMQRLVLVTNPEPTAHASAGAYAKEVQRLFPGTTIHLWHNRYTGRLKEGFHPSDVAGNYNRFVDPEDRLTDEESALMNDFAFVPEDPALDLLQGEPNPGIHVLRCMRDSIDYAHGRLLWQATKKLGLAPRMQEVVTTYVARNPDIADTEAYLDAMASYLGDAITIMDDATAPSRSFSKDELAALSGFLAKVTKSGLRREMLRMQEILDAQIGRMEEARGPFASRLGAAPDRAIDRELGRFLVILDRAGRGSSLMRNQGVLLLFYFSLHKLFQSRTLVAVLKSLIPRRTSVRGRKVRDRFSQIRSLVERDPEYRQRYLKTVKTLNGLVIRQIAAVAKALDLRNLVVLDGESHIDARPYLKLLSAFLHETLYSGLSVIVGFDYRSAAAAFQAGAEKLLQSLRKAS
jgi:flagellar biosynthesis protein FlhG